MYLISFSALNAVTLTRETKAFLLISLPMCLPILYTVQRGLALREFFDRESKTALDRIPR